MKRQVLHQKLVAHVNRKKWWHVPPADPDAYQKRGKFLASSFREAEFWGRPSNEPIRVSIARPLVGDEASIEKALFGERLSSEEKVRTIKLRWKLDALIKKMALRKGYDSIVLMSPKGYLEFKKKGRTPRSIELNILLNS
jgi:hypothetical protein